MRAFSLARKSFFKPFDKALIRTIFPIYLIFGLIISLLYMAFDKVTSTYMILLIGFILIFVISTIQLILIIGLRSNILHSKFIFPKLGLLFKKAWTIFIASILSLILIMLGTLCFIIPGIFIAKRHIYIRFIVENETIGPLEAMRKSSVLSKQNGWAIIIEGIYCSILWLILAIPIFLIDSTINTNSEVLRIVGELIMIIFQWFTWTSVLSVYFYGYLNTEKSNLVKELN